jgi:hypothetical protein
MWFSDYGYLERKYIISIESLEIPLATYKKNPRGGEGDKAV